MVGNKIVKKVVKTYSGLSFLFLKKGFTGAGTMQSRIRQNSDNFHEVEMVSSEANTIEVFLFSAYVLLFNISNTVRLFRIGLIYAYIYVNYRYLSEIQLKSLTINTI